MTVLGSSVTSRPILAASVPRNPTVRSIELEGDYFHARVRDPERFDEIRTPEWASNVADDVEAGAEVRMGHSGDDWSSSPSSSPRTSNGPRPAELPSRCSRSSRLLRARDCAIRDRDSG